MAWIKIFKGCCSANAVQVIPDIPNQSGTGRESNGVRSRTSNSRRNGRLSENLDQLTALATDERIEGAIHLACHPRYGGAANTDGETLSLAESLLDRFDDDIQWHKQRKDGVTQSANRRTSHLEAQQAAAMHPNLASPISLPQSQLETKKFVLKGRVDTFPETSSEGSASMNINISRLKGPAPTPPGMKMMADPGQHISPTDWGFPGFLSSAEYDVYLQFRSEIAKRPPLFRDTIYCFGYEEEEPYALCRWLRARKFDYDKVIQMVEQAIECSAEAARKGFYPNPREALGVEPSIYFSLYPELFCGYSKLGCPLYITRAGECDIRKIMSVTTEAKIINFHWHCMRIAFGGRLSKKKRSDPNVHRFEGFVIFDMEGLSIQGCMDALNVFKEQSSIDQLCFPESLNRFIVINAPSAFSVVWRIVKTLVDARTAAKVEIYSSRRPVWEKRLLELINEDELPMDYGGKAPSTIEIYKKQTTDEGLSRQFTMPITARSTEESFEVRLQDGESLELSVFTKSTKTGYFSISEIDESDKGMDAEGISSEIHKLEVRHKGEGFRLEQEEPSLVKFPRLIKGPGKFKITASCKEGKEVFILVGKVMSQDCKLTNLNPSPNKFDKNEGRVKETYESTFLTPPAKIKAPLHQESEVKKQLKLQHPDLNGRKLDQYNSRPLYGSYNATVGLPSNLDIRAIYITMGVVVLIMLHDFWLMWALSEVEGSCDCLTDT